MKLNEFDDVAYYREEIEKAGLPVSKLGAKLKIRGEDGESKWLNINADSIKALNSWFNKKNGSKKVIKENDEEFEDFKDFIFQSSLIYFTPLLLDLIKQDKDVRILGKDKQDFERGCFYKRRDMTYDISNESDAFHAGLKCYDEYNKKTNNKDKMMKTDKTKKIVKEAYDDAKFFDFIERDAGMRHEALEYMKGYMDAETLLTELISALGDDTALDNLGYIARMNDIPKPDELDESAEKKVVNENVKTIRDVAKEYPELYDYDYDYKWSDSENYRNLEEVLDYYGYYIVNKKDRDNVGEYNDIKAYYGIKVEDVSDHKLRESAKDKSSANESLTENTITMDQFYTNMLK